MTILTQKLDQYEAQHTSGKARLCHASGILALWLGCGMFLWLVPPPSSNLRAGFAAVLVMFVVYFYYHKLSRPLAWSSALLFIPAGFGMHAAYLLLSHTAFVGSAGILCTVGLASHIHGGWRSGYVLSRFWREEMILAPAWLLQQLLAIWQARQSR